MSLSPTLIRRSRSNSSLLPVCAPPQTKSSSSTTRVVLSLIAISLLCLTAGLSGSGAPVPTSGPAGATGDADQGSTLRLLSAELDGAMPNAASTMPNAASSTPASATSAASVEDPATATAALASEASEVVLSAAAAAVCVHRYKETLLQTCDYSHSLS